MAKLDDANTTGFYSERVQLTAANGFEKAKSYSIYISAAVGAITGTMSHSFNVHALADYKADVSALATSAALATVDGIIDAILLDTGTDGVVLKAAGLAADAVTEIEIGVWTYDTRVLTQAVSSDETTGGDDISRKRGNDWTIAITGLGDISGRDKLYFSIKNQLTDADSASILQIEETDGLLYLNAAVYGTAAHGAIVVDDEVAGDITITVSSGATYQLPIKSNMVFDVKKLESGADLSLTQANFDVTGDVTRAVT